MLILEMGFSRSLETREVESHSLICLAKLLYTLGGRLIVFSSHRCNSTCRTYSSEGGYFWPLSLSRKSCAFQARLEIDLIISARQLVNFLDLDDAQ